ncbi:MAG TPA: hypothetical protein VFS44_07470 [Gemmatimonadaceae bacterium]|nr:hypothetical protein [Gemmatimonadaceae bacterium]
MSAASATVEHATCLGCGCTCDDIAVVVRDDRIAEARNACPLGAAWFGDGTVPGEVRARGASVSLDAALDAAAALLAGARRPLVQLAPDISCETQRAALAIADRLHALADGVTSSTAAGGVLAAQRRGRAGATLGEIRNRADLVLFWGVDPARRYPRFTTRYAPDPPGLFVPEGRAGRTVAGVDVGEAAAPPEAEPRVRLEDGEELDALTALRTLLAERTPSSSADALAKRVAPLAERLRGARYAVVVYDGESSVPGDTRRAEGVIALVQQLNARTRAALCTLRAGGNRSGAEAVMTWQTGFPMCVDFSRGTPRYRPDDGAAAWLRSGEVDALLVVGDARAAPVLPADDVPRVIIGPRASTATPAPAVAIDTGVAGIHDGGTAYRMDDVPLPLRPSVPGPRSALDVVGALAERVRRARGERGA